MLQRLNMRFICHIVVAGIVVIVLVLFERSTIRYGRAKSAASAVFEEYGGTGITVFCTFGEFWGVQIDDARFADEDARELVVHLKDNHAVEYVGVRGTSLTDLGCATLSEMRAARMVDLSGTEVTTGGIKHLRGLPRLTSLILADTRIDDNVIPVLAAMESLEAVDLRNTRVTGRGKVRLERMRPDMMVTAGEE